MFLFLNKECPILKKVIIIMAFTFMCIGLYCSVSLKSMLGSHWSEEFPLIKTQSDARVKKIAFWTTWFGKSLWGPHPEGMPFLNCGAKVTCRFYNARKQPLLYDALLFHGRDPQNPPPVRSPNQAYIMFLKESPAHSKYGFVPGNTFYNWSMTYSPRSDFDARYLRIRRRRLRTGNDRVNVHHRNNSATGKSGNQTLPGTLSGHDRFYNLPVLEAALHHVRHDGEANTFWVVSNCNTTSRRELYVDTLKQHSAVDIYGGCAQDCKAFEKQSGLHCDDYLARTGQYKFYLSFENSVCRDYITEKVYYPLKHGIVPVVYGGLSTKEYTTLLPPGSFIDVRNFTSPKHLAEYLLYLDKNNKAYLAYHAWREEWEVENGRNIEWCGVCRALHNVGNVPPRNVDWGKFWNPATECDGHLLEKVLGKDA